MPQRRESAAGSGIQNIHQSSTVEPYRRTSSSSIDDLVSASPSAPSASLTKQSSTWGLWPKQFPQKTSLSPERASAINGDSSTTTDVFNSAETRVSPGSINQDIWKSASSPWNESASIAASANNDQHDAPNTYRRTSLTSKPTYPLPRRTSNGTDDVRSPLFGLNPLNGQVTEATEPGFRANPTSPRFFGDTNNNNDTPVSGGFNNAGGNILERFSFLGEATREAEMFGGMKQLNINEGNIGHGLISRKASKSEVTSPQASTGFAALSAFNRDITSPYVSPKPGYASPANAFIVDRAAKQASSRSSSFGNGVWQPPYIAQPDEQESLPIKSPGFEVANNSIYNNAGAKTPASFSSFPVSGQPIDDSNENEFLPEINAQAKGSTTSGSTSPYVGGNALPARSNSIPSGTAPSRANAGSNPAPFRQTLVFQNAAKFGHKGSGMGSNNGGATFSTISSNSPTTYSTAAATGAPSFRPSGYDPSKSYDFVPGAGIISPKGGNSPAVANASLNEITGGGKSSGTHNNGSNGGRGGGRRNHDVSIARSPLLEEFRNNKNRKLEMKDLHGHVVEFSSDQHGSRFIQHKLETASNEDKDMVFSEVRPNSLQLMTDVFGNYVIQKFFELGNNLQRTILAKQMESHVLDLSFQMYGCRVVQKAIENIDTEQQVKLVKELDGHILRCVKDQNGNHVVQKAIEKIPPKLTGFIIDSFHDQTYQLATHPYGCRVIQRMLEYSSSEAERALLDELHTYTFYLVEDQYGNYVIQHVIEHGRPEDKNKIIDIVRSSVMTFSRHKFASNVVEKCIIFGTEVQRRQMIDEILTPRTDGTTPITVMMKDQFANYVIQKLLDSTSGDEHNRLAAAIRPHLTALKRYSYGKHLTSIEKLVGSDGEPTARRAFQKDV